MKLGIKGISVRSLLLLLILQCALITGDPKTDILDDGNITTYDNELLLRGDLLRNYNVHVLPKPSMTKPIRVEIRLSLVSIRELNEKNERLTVDTFVKLVWNDSRLIWDADKYGGIQSVRFPDHMIWQPDIKLFNSARASEIDPWGDVYTKVYSNGTVRWIPPATFHSICNVDLRFYPYDVQSCKLKFGSWTLDGHHVDIALSEDEEPLVKLSDAYNENNEWEVIESNASKKIRYFPCCEEPYPLVTYHLRLRRRAPYYKLTTLFPTFSVVILTLASFWLPPTSSERITLGCVNLLALVIILLHLSWKIPPTGKTVPMIVWFCGNNVLIVTATIVLSMVSITFGRARHTRPAPKFLKIIHSSWFGSFLCVNASTVSHASKRREPSLDLETEDIRLRSCGLSKEQYFAQDWLRCLQVFDRIIFLVFIVIFALVLGSSFE